MASGRLILTVIEAKLTHDTEWFAKMDPFCRINVREQTFETKVIKKGGKLPSWKEEFSIDVLYVGDDLNICVLDKDLASVDVVGEAVIKLSALCCNGGTDDWYGLNYKGKSAGRIHLKGIFTPL
jgi:Ca2+-dependent lipid-binding protein